MITPEDVIAIQNKKIVELEAKLADAEECLELKCSECSIAHAAITAAERGNARAALAAIEEPSVDMMNAGISVCGSDGSVELVGKIWRAMLHKAMEEK